MHVATLITNPADPVLTVDRILPYHRRLGGGEFRWLAEGVACEFPIAAPPAPAERRALWQELQDRGIDLVIQPAGARRKKLLVADMDSTMIGQECIDELADLAGVGEQVAAITARAMNGELDFEGALRERVRLLAGRPSELIDRVLAERLTPAPGAEVLVATMKFHGAHTLLVSGGFTVFAEAVGHGLGFDEVRANELIERDGVITGEVGEPILGRDAKLRALEEVSARLGLTPEDAIAVGDGANDLAMIERAGLGVALHAKPSVQARAPHVINHGDLTALLYIQGYARSDFVDPASRTGRLRLVAAQGEG